MFAHDILRLDEPSVGQRVQMCTHGFFAQSHRFTDNGTAYFVCAVLQALTVNQVEIHQQWALFQAELENFLRKGERVRRRRC